MRKNMEEKKQKEEIKNDTKLKKKKGQKGIKITQLSTSSPFMNY
jgi:ethanolamine utilization protein EutQ (cupin superfamily)